MIVEEFKRIAEECGYIFNYGEPHWQNLLDSEDDTDKEKDCKNTFLLLWEYTEILSSRPDSFGHISKAQYNGVFTLSFRSRIDDKDFNYKEDKHFKPLRECLDKVNSSLDACGYNFESQVIKKYENILDDNHDLLHITFKANKV